MIKLFLTGFLLCCTAFLLYGCGESGSAETVWIQGESFTAAGSVTTETGQPASGALLQLYRENSLPKTVQAADDGTYRFTGLKKGEYGLFVAYPGFEGEERTVSIVSHSLTGIDFILRRNTVSLSGNAVGDDETALPGTLLQLYAGEVISDPPAAERIAADDGSFVFDGLQPGVYTLNASLAGYTPETGTYDLRQMSVSGETIVLTRLVLYGFVLQTGEDGEPTVPPDAQVRLTDAEGTVLAGPADVNPDSGAYILYPEQAVQSGVLELLIGGDVAASMEGLAVNASVRQDLTLTGITGFIGYGSNPASGGYFPLGGATAFLYKGGEKIAETIIADNGSYAFANVLYGNGYTVSLIKNEDETDHILKSTEPFDAGGFIKDKNIDYRGPMIYGYVDIYGLKLDYDMYLLGSSDQMSTPLQSTRTNQRGWFYFLLTAAAPANSLWINYPDAFSAERVTEAVSYPVTHFIIWF